MGRPREFDEMEALTDAMRVFWLKGYESTSMSDLMEAMHLHKGSIYKAFGDKHTLFMAALKHYLAQGEAGFQRVLSISTSPKEAIRGFLRMSLRQCTSGPVVRGCLMMNSVVELAPHDEKVKKMIADYMSDLETRLSVVIEEGQRLSQFRSDKTGLELAQYLLFVKAGLLTGSKVNSASQDPFEAADLALSALY